jgi:hypothetical protein
MIYYYENVLENVLSSRHKEYAELMLYNLKNNMSDKPLKHEPIYKPAAARSVYCEVNGRTYESLKEASFDLGINRNLASEMIRGLRGNKFKISYIDKRKDNKFASKKIMCGLHNKTYNSVSEAALDLKLHRGTIQGQLKGRITNRLKLSYIEKD